ncbi:MAG: GntR family transcriptional regulator [Ramlibacter sp.]|jgi:GntR family transcriptional repressor for pyruvate dehydrogenase complex|nr:GntR family transcriptional regulator [Ramlibacter sp.]
MNACALSALSFAPVQAGRAFDDISTQIRQAMASGVLKPGTRLPPERTLAAQFGVSRNTLREALRSLESSGVLQLRRGAHAGCYICDSSGRGVATGLLDMYKLGGVTPGQLTDARILVETAIVRAACENCTPDDLRELRANVAKAVKLHKEGRVDERLQANLDFHRLLARATHNPLLVMVMEAILDVMQAFVGTIGSYDASFLFASRRRFIALLASRDGEGAAGEMEKSLRQLQKRYLSRLP